MAIDWTKPVEVVECDGRIYRTEHVWPLDKGGAIVVWREWKLDQHFSEFHEDGTCSDFRRYIVRNLPPPKREYWLNLYRQFDGRLTAAPSLQVSEDQAKAVAGPGLVATVKVYEEEEPKGE